MARCLGGRKKNVENLVSLFIFYAIEGHKSKTKDSTYNMHLNFWSCFSRKKVHIIHG